MKKGFTLIEVMIALAIFSIFIGFVYKTYYVEIRTSLSMNKSIDLEYNASKVMNRMVNEIRTKVSPSNINIISSDSINSTNSTNSTILVKTNSNHIDTFSFNGEDVVQVSDMYNILVKLYAYNDGSGQYIVFINVHGNYKDDNIVLRSAVTISN
ncbi:type II secretion system protein J [Clostridium sp. DJ247]|uniref:PulJ/GspJ family protein n=1 Tax=Clostridium sp. DJ247 TaxID=2726188 RepID=UPI00162A9BF4|nr:prepilin-type N-terminal cleavage/methylation domain-containing protein [Clostridium sp. DJ247]MBC2579948.1 prepilin-type N-terminal cleavage/methylation domain-containing protein [Clostridium sp. DJ247]